MNPYRPYRLSAVPRTLHTQLEIAKAIRTLAGPDEDELLRQRRAEIAAIRRDLDALKRGVRKLGEELPAPVMAELQSELKKYNPDQPRVQAGNRDGGQWTSGSKAGSEAPDVPSRRSDVVYVCNLLYQLPTDCIYWCEGAGTTFIRQRNLGLGCPSLIVQPHGL
jgi:hypothetical protein